MPTLTPMVVAFVLASWAEGCTKTRPPERFAPDVGVASAGAITSPGWFGSAGASDGPPIGACCAKQSFIVAQAYTSCC